MLAPLHLTDWLVGLSASVWGAFTISREDITGPVSALVIMIGVGIAVWRIGVALFKYYIKREAERAAAEEEEAKKREARHDAMLALQRDFSEKLTALLITAQQREDATTRALEQNASAIQGLTETLKSKPCIAKQ